MEKEKLIRTKDGVSLSMMVFEPNHPNKSVIVIGPSAAIDQRFYNDFANFLVQHNFTVITFDYRGIGRSLFGPIKGFQATLSQWGRFDLDSILLTAKNLFPTFELVFIGHQLSGELLSLAPAFQFVNRVVFIGSGLSSWRFWPLRIRFKISIIKLIRPLLSIIYQYFPGNQLNFLQDLPSGVAEEWIKMYNYREGLFKVMGQKNHDQFYGPLISYSFTDDQLAPAKAVNALLKYFPNARIDAHQIAPIELGVKQIKHLGFLNKEVANNLWEDIIKWLNDPGLS